MKELIDKVGVRNLIAAVVVGLSVAAVVLAATGGFRDDVRDVQVRSRPRPTAEATTLPRSFPDAPADEGAAGPTQRYGSQRESSSGYYDPRYYGAEYDDDAAEAYYGYYGYPYEESDDGETYVPPPSSDDDGGGSGTAGEPGQPGYPYGDNDGSGGVGGQGGPGGGGGGG